MSGVRGGMAGALHRLDPLAPDWLVRILAPKPAPTPWPDMVRAALAVGGALAAGVATGNAALGGLLGFGAITGAFGDQGGPFGQRARRVLAGALGAIAGLVVGGQLLPAGGFAVAIVVAAGVVSALVSSISSAASFGGLQFLVMLSVASGLGAVPLPPVLLAFCAGALWALALSGVQSVLLPDRSGPRHAVAAALSRLDELVGAAASGGDLDAARTALAAALATGFDAVTGARAVSSGRRDDLQRLAAVLGAIPQLARAAVAAAAVSPASVQGVAARTAALRRRVLSRTGAQPSAPLPTDQATARALERLERLAGAPDPAAPPRPPVTARDRLGAVAERMTNDRTVVFAVRLGSTLGVAEALRRVLPLIGVVPPNHAYWLLLTVAVVLKPDLGSVFARGVQRSLGTLVGVALGVAVLALVPSGPPLLIPVTLLALLFPFAARRNYGMLSTFITPLVLIFVSLSGEPTRGLLQTRLLDTVLGAVVVLVVGYLPYPSTWRPRIGRDAAAAVDALAAYAAVAVDGPEASIGPSRRRAYAVLQDLSSDLQSALAEPPPRSRYAAAWWPVLGQLEQIADDLRDASLLDREQGGPTTATGSRRVVVALREVASAMRARRPPARLPLPETGPLADAGEDVAALRRLLDGPQPAGQRPVA